MIFPDVKLEEWLTKNPALKVVKTTCIDCGAEIVADRPYITKHYVGLTCRRCPCGSVRSGCSSQTTRTKEEHQSWSEVLGDGD